MSLSELLTTALVLGGLAYVIIVERRKKNPQAFNWIISWIKSSQKKKIEEFKDKTQQIYPERRQIM